MHSLTVFHGGRFRTDLPISAISELLEDPHSTLWLDVQDPDEADVALLREEFGFHPLAIEDAIRSHERPKVDAYGVPGDEDHDGVPDPIPGPSDPAGGTWSAGGDATPPGGGGQESPSEGVLIPLAPLGPEAGSSDTGRAAATSYYFVVFYAASYDPQEEHIRSRALSLFIGPNYLVTVHAGLIPHIPATLARWRAPNSPLGHRVAVLVHALLDAIVDDYFPLMDAIADRAEDLEDTIFIHFDESSIETIFRLKKDLLAMRRVVAPERDVLNVLLRRQLPIFSAEDTPYLQDVYDHIVRVTDSIDTYRDLLSSALDSYLSLQSNRLNQIMKLLTIGSIILMSAALITGFYGQNFKTFPELDWPIGAAWSLILMAIATVGLALYFKRLKWW